MAHTLDLAQATAFMWAGARLLDRRRFAQLFLGGERQATLDALRPYQNSDGGFGSALEPDLRGPDSQPIPTWTALVILEEADALGEPMAAQACDYLQTITTAEGGVPFMLPTARGYPHAPWWECDDNPPASLNPTAAIAALLHKRNIAHPWLAPATDYCWRELETTEDVSPYTMRAVLPLLDYTPDRERAEQVFARLGPKLLAEGHVALTPTDEADTHTPLNFAPTPQSIARRLFSEEIIAAHLDALVAAQQSDGGWPINWLAWNPLAAQEWRGVVTIDALSILRAYGRLS